MVKRKALDFHCVTKMQNVAHGRFLAVTDIYRYLDMSDMVNAPRTSFFANLCTLLN